MKASVTIVVAILVNLSLLGGIGTRPASATLSPTVKCEKSKLTAAGKAAASKLGCYAKAVAAGVAVESDCLTTAGDKISDAFAKADSKGGCAAINNISPMTAAVNSCVSSVLTNLSLNTLPSSPAACAKAKLKASAKKAKNELKCHIKAHQDGVTVSSVCLTSAATKFAIAFDKAQADGVCAGSETTVGTTLSSCVSTLLAGVNATTSPTPTPSPGAGCGSEPSTFTGVVAAHNYIRAHASPAPVPALGAVCWNNTVATTAQAWADGCNYNHNPSLLTLGYGENIYAVSGNQLTAAPVNAVNTWASEAASYNYAANTCSGVCGHYTQEVWRATNTVGCGKKYCTTNSPFGPSFPTWTFVVCDYQPAGNYNGQRPY